MITIEQMVQREVQVCLSHLVSTLAGYSGYQAPKKGDVAGAAMYDLCLQAQELDSPVEDWEESAIQEGWSAYAGVWRHKDALEGSARSPKSRGYTDIRELCEANEIEPYQNEVFEHWAVSPWLAEKLAACGEKVDNDFANMCVWARTTTGQGIAMDGVIQRVYADMIKPA